MCEKKPPKQKTITTQQPTPKNPQKYQSAKKN